MSYWNDVRALAENWYRDRQTVRDYALHPKPEKPSHRMHPIYLACMDCGRTAPQIALDEWRPCFEVTR